MLLTMLGSLLGGVGLFLLGMRLMTDGLKYAAGQSLRHILARSTSTPFLGILSGAFLTSLVQSSSAVTVAAIGFVNAGLMDIAQAITIIYGSNIGTTMTGWLVSMLGFHINIKVVAVPAIGIGMLMRVVRHNTRWGALGDVLAGFGVFFVGIDILKDAFASLGESIQIVNFGPDTLGTLLIFVGIGFLMTLLMQSSSAAIAIILTAVAGNVITMNDAAALVIGANVGTTSTAALSVIGATSSAKRLATAHVIFNLLTGIVALLMLPFLMTGLVHLQEAIGLSGTPTTLLALFHTTFNILGVLLMLPLTKRLVGFLEQLFRTREEDESQPRHLDKNVVGTPVMAIQALAMELKRIGDIAGRMAKGAISAEVAPGPRLQSDKGVIDKLVIATSDFTNLMLRSNMPKDMDDLIANALRVSGYYHDVADIAIDLADVQSGVKTRITHPELVSEVMDFKSNVVQFLKKTDVGQSDFSRKECRNELENLKEVYRSLKARLLRAASKGELSVPQMAQSIEVIGRIRRIAEQSEKGARYLAGLKVTAEIEVETVKT
ncbi:Na/Pi cotransporter family protein [Thermodesulfobacteriota bacterium]